MAYKPFSGETVDWSKPVLFVQSERPFSTNPPVNLGYLEKLSTDGGEDIAGFDACNSLTPLKQHPEKHTLALTCTLMELDQDPLEAVFGLQFSDNLMRVPSSREPVRCQVQLIVPEMDDEDTAAWGLWITNAVITLDYGRDYSTKNPLGVTLKITAEPEDGVVLEDGIGTLYQKIKRGATINLDPETGTGYSAVGWDSGGGS